jgi:putative ABC transport system substrate-binding protein
LPVIGFLGYGHLGPIANFLATFRGQLVEAGFAEGRNVTIDYRFAEGQYDRLPELAADLVRRNVAVIVITNSALSAKAAYPAGPRRQPSAPW